MKNVYLFLSMLFMAKMSIAQDCSNGRYLIPQFTNVTEVKNVKYGQNFKQDGTTNEDLFMDIYYPTNDTDNNRPVVLLAHGGSFIAGNRGDLADLCRNYAKLGYVTVSMSYRLLTVSGSLLLNPSLEFQKEVVRAVHDMKAAIRFLRKSHTESNPYGINPNIFIVGGYSAGAILANHTAYLDQENEIPTDLQSYFAAQGGLEGNSGNPGLSSKVSMVVSMCGAIKDTAWMTTGSVPYVGVHNETDNTVPNISGSPSVGVSIPITLYGDSSMYKRALTQSIPAKYKMVPTTGHCDFPAVETFTFVTQAVYDQLCIQGGLEVNKVDQISFNAFPNPAMNELFVQIPGNNKVLQFEIFDVLGNNLKFMELNKDLEELRIDISSLPSGVYSLRLTQPEGISSVKRIVKM